MYCKSCGLSFGDDLKFCTSCGEKLIDPELMAMLPAEEQDAENMTDMLTWRLLSLSLELTEKASIDFDDIDEELNANMAMIEAFSNGDFDKFSELEKIAHSDEKINAKTGKAQKRIKDIFSYIRKNMWIFRAADYILRKAGRDGIDMSKFKPAGINLSELGEIEENLDKSIFLDDSNFALNDYLFELSDFATEVQEKLEELEETS